VDRKLPAFHDDLLFVAMDRRWKLIHHAGEPANDELYDLREDPGETANAAALHPEERRRLLERIEKSGALRIETDAPAAPIDDEEREKLRALGYIGG